MSRKRREGEEMKGSKWRHGVWRMASLNKVEYYGMAYGVRVVVGRGSCCLLTRASKDSTSKKTIF